MKPSAPRDRSARFSMVLVLPALLAGGGLRAQTYLDREFEGRYFYGLEMEADRSLDGASLETRKAAVALFRDQRRAAVSGSLAGERARILLRILAILSGRKSGDRAFLERGNFFLLALPEVLDPEKRGRDLRRVLEMASRIYPLLDPSVKLEDPDSVMPGASVVHLTARAAFSWKKPKDLKLEMRILDRKGRVLERAERGDAEDEEGWLRHDLHLPFDLKGLPPGLYRGKVLLGSRTAPMRPDDPSPERIFWIRPGFHRDAWRLLKARETLLGREGPGRPGLDPLARLEICCREVTRALLGDPYALRSWPVRALEEGLELARLLGKGEREKRPENGDRVYGIPLAGGAVVPLRVIWKGIAAEGKARSGAIVFPPSGWDENFLLEGLGIPEEDLLPGSGRLLAVLHLPGGEGYLPEVQRFLEREFGLAAGSTSLIGVEDGCFRARLGLGLMKGPFARLVLVGRDLPDASLLSFEDCRRIEVRGAWGRPSSEDFEALPRLVERVTGRREHPSLRLDPDSDSPRSFAAAIRASLEWDLPGTGR